jgi:Glutaredoxin-like domain (DUF836)
VINLLISRKLALKILSMLKQLNLYSTAHCHLCELAHEIVLQMSGDITVNVIEIADDEALLANYGLRIPVLQRPDTQVELNWPFSLANVADFLN